LVYVRIGPIVLPNWSSSRRREHPALATGRVRRNPLVDSNRERL
jgi:hypothetical protein